MNSLLSQINNTSGLIWGNTLVGGGCLCPWQQNKQSPSVHVLTDMQCHRGAKDNTSMLLCPWSPPALLSAVSTCGWQAATTSCQRSEMTIRVHSEASEMMTQRDKVSWSPDCPSASGEQWSISSCPLDLRRRWAVTGLLCLASIWPPVSESRPIRCLLPLHCLCWKTKTPCTI